MAGNEPLRTIPAIGIGIAATDHFACRGERKCVKASINGGVATDLYEAQINPSGRALLYGNHESNLPFPAGSSVVRRKR